MLHFRVRKWLENGFFWHINVWFLTATTKNNVRKKRLLHFLSWFEYYALVVQVQFSNIHALLNFSWKISCFRPLRHKNMNKLKKKHSVKNRLPIKVYKMYGCWDASNKILFFPSSIMKFLFWWKYTFSTCCHSNKDYALKIQPVDSSTLGIMK